MLVLSREEDQSVMIGDEIEVKVIRSGGRVRLGFIAPGHIKIHRKEVFLRIQDDQANLESESSDAES